MKAIALCSYHNCINAWIR